MENCTWNRYRNRYSLENISSDPNKTDIISKYYINLLLLQINDDLI